MREDFPSAALRNSQFLKWFAEKKCGRAFHGSEGQRKGNPAGTIPGQPAWKGKRQGGIAGPVRRKTKGETATRFSKNRS